MYYETAKNDHGLRYNPIKACVVPRPIGWITTINEAGLVNLAPFSFFNMLSYDPPFVMFSAGVHEADGGRKDTVANVEATGEFVYNMATWAQKDQMNETARIMERGVDEMIAAGLEPLPSRLVRPPRVKGSPVHFECRLHQVVKLPGRLPLGPAPRGDRAGRGGAFRRCGPDRGRSRRHPEDSPDRPPRLQGLRLRRAMFQMEKRSPEDLVRPA